MPAGSGLASFMSPRSNSRPTSSEPVDPRKARAAMAKVKTKDRRPGASPAHNGMAPNSRYQNGHPDSYPQDEHQTTSGRDIFEDSTVSSDFDVTKGTIEMEAAQFNNPQLLEPMGEYSDEEVTVHRDLGIDTYSTDPGPSLIQKASQGLPRQQNRFQQPLQHRSASPAAATQKSSQKRERTNERQDRHPSVAEAHYQQQHQQQEYQMQYVQESQGGQGLDGYDHLDTQDELISEGFFGSTVHSSSVGSPIHQSVISDVEGSEIPKRLPVPSDYTDEELKRKRYTDLKEERWGAGMGRYKLPRHFPDELRGDNITFQQKIEKFRSVKASTESELVACDNEQAHFFEHMEEEEWEAAGDYIREKTLESMQALRNVRKRKRDITARYEKIYEERVMLIERKASLITAQFTNFQTSGGSMMSNMLKPSTRLGGSSRSSSRA